MDVIRVACALIRNESGAFLCARRSPLKSFPGLWEFPGGKLEDAESPPQALIREIREELGVEIVPTGEHSRSTFAAHQPPIELIALHARLVSGLPRPIEHQEIRWVLPQDLPSLAWAPADLSIVSSLSKAS